MRCKARIRARIGDAEINHLSGRWSLPRHTTPTSCMLPQPRAYHSHALSPLTHTCAHARAREIIELFRLWATTSWPINCCDDLGLLSSGSPVPLTIARANLNAICHVICLSHNFSVAKA